MISEEVLLAQAKMSQFTDREKLALSVIVDIGTVTKITGAGNNVDVTSFRTVHGMSVTYNNVEVIYPAGIRMSLGNALVLIVAPCSCIPDTSTGTSAEGAYPYDGRGMKAIPITNSVEANRTLSLLNTRDTFTVSSKDYSFSFLQNAISFITNNLIKVEVTPEAVLLQWKSSLSFSISDHGVSEVFSDANGRTTKLVFYSFDGVETTYIGSDEELTVQQTIDPSSYTKWKWVYTTKASGDITYTQYSNGSPINEITVSGDGALSIVHNTNFKIEVGESIKLTGSTGSLEVL